MIAWSHLVFGMLFAIFYLDFFPVNFKFIFFSLVLLGSLLPDIDHPNSFVGKYFKPIGWFVDHRGFFHSFSFLIILTIICYTVFPSQLFLAIPLGYFAHLFADSLTKEGVMLVYPFKIKIRGFISTGSILEHAIASFVVAFLLYKAFFL